MAWMHKNVALLEPDADGTDWAISVYKIEDKSACLDEAECVHYHGWVSATTPNFPHSGRAGRFPCQLFVDTQTGVYCGGASPARGGEPYSKPENCDDLTQSQQMMCCTAFKPKDYLHTCAFKKCVETN